LARKLRISYIETILTDSILAYDVQHAMMTLEADGETRDIEISGLLVSRAEGEEASLRVVIGECVHIIGYAEMHAETHECIVRAIMCWSAGRMTASDKAKYTDIVRMRASNKAPS
jgi:hypothetical protein